MPNQTGRPTDAQLAALLRRAARHVGNAVAWDTPKSRATGALMFELDIAADALRETPREPSPEQIERAADVIWDMSRDHTVSRSGLRPVAAAALRAAFSELAPADG